MRATQVVTQCARRPNLVLNLTKKQVHTVAKLSNQRSQNATAMNATTNQPLICTKACTARQLLHHVRGAHAESASANRGKISAELDSSTI
jgi:hypothetical protein